MDDPAITALASKVRTRSNLHTCKSWGVPVSRQRTAVDGVFPQYARDPAQILLRWSLQKGFVPLPKSATPARIHSNTHLYDFVLTEEDMAALDALDRGKDGAISWNPVDAD
ncbi:hypothetical protein H0H81_005148 [Sphagnurus paluster]|uniref:NADP-dependent oxidoreductase domain-containing protein n=1 Tax=Sphagnurus paluster TaxID=117069 RepID=A0A9P7KH97_9AGAR|nr:hypothetical protein H0H81_005148 [Sphagnurus paluster]